jgi:hypothetical protein
MTANFDREAILRTWQIFRQPGEVLELRIPKAGRYKTISGYFNESSALADAVVGLADEPFAGIYFTINPVKPDLLARASNRYAKYAETTTSDADIIALHWLPVDLDAKRPAGISSTDAEHDAAISKAREIRHWLIEEQAWPKGAFVLADSGNGGHLNVKIDLHNMPENVALVKGCLEALDYLFSDDIVQVDTTSQNPARIWKLYGTMARKGDSIRERPHRMARLIDVPETTETVFRSQLEALAAMLPRQEGAPKDQLGGKGFEPVQYCHAHNLQVHHTKSYAGGTLAVLEECIFDPSHKLSACIIGWPNGASTYRCRHHSCLDKRWKDVKARIEYGAKDCDQKQGPKSAPKGEGALSDTALGNYPRLEDLTKATGRIDRVNPVTGEKEADPITGETKIPKLTLSPTKASAAIAEFMPLRLSATDKKDTPKLWRYNSGIWQTDGEKQVINLIDAIIGDLSYERGLKETMRRVRALLDTVTFDSDPCIFPALDGVLDLRTGQVRAFQLDDYLTFQYGVSLKHPEADYHPVLWFLCSIFPDPRDVLTGIDIFTAAIIRQAFEAIIQLIGPGGNGKGIFEKIMTAICTADRTTALTLVEAKASRFGPGALLGKDLWILSEVEDVRSTINLLKKVSTGEMVDSDQKYGDRVQGRPHVLPVLDCNNAIDFGDDSWGRKRRVVKLDFPFTFDYSSDTRPKDPHLEEKLTSPAALAGLLQIMAARAPYLCKSKRIYTRKRPEEMAEEYRRQQFSLHFFCEECLSTSMPTTEDGKPVDVKTGMVYPDGKAPRLTTDALYAEYLEYCRLFNVPVPAEKGQVGKYIKEKFDIASTVTTVDKVSARCYPGLWLSKSANLAYAELSLNYSNYTKTTDKLQKGEGKSDISSLLTTATTEEWPKEVIEEIVRMFNYIQSCQNPQDISYEGYLKNGVVSVVAVVSGPTIAKKDNSPVVVLQLSCSYSPEYLDEVLVCRRPKRAIAKGITDPMKLAEDCRLPVCLTARFQGVNSIAGEAVLLRLAEHRRETHFVEQAAKYTGKPFPTAPEAIRPVCYLRDLRIKAIMEFGMFGWDDPLKLSREVGLPVCLIMKGLDHLGYERYERSGGGIAYRQKRAGSPGKAEA